MGGVAGHGKKKDERTKGEAPVTITIRMKKLERGGDEIYDSG